MSKPKIVAITGSIKRTSVNTHVLKFIKDNAKDLDVTLFDELDTLPYFNPDHDNENPPEPVIRFRSMLRESAAVLICTPEYAFNIPGILKNALDWLVSSGELNEKIVFTISASPLPSGGDNAQLSLGMTLTALGSKIDDEWKLLIPRAKVRINEAGEIIDNVLKAELRELIQKLLIQLS
jgi:chromate reductase, NAD(P)H dehydrogenase (quinone)